MIKQAQNTWYVSYRLREQFRKDGYSRRRAKSFPNEAKNFARSKFTEAQDIAECTGWALARIRRAGTNAAK
jgi:hypothetical protein